MNLSMNDRKKAVLLTTALLVIAVLCVVRIYVVSHSSVENGQALYADLYQNGELLQTIRLDTVTAEYTFEVSGNAGATNTVCVRPGSIAIVSASCPDQICVHQGFISKMCIRDRIKYFHGEFKAAHINGCEGFYTHKVPHFPNR